MTLPVLGLPEISRVATADLVFAAVRDALIAHAEGRTSVPPPMVLADEGKLTAWRTAAAGALVTDAMTPGRRRRTWDRRATASGGAGARDGRTAGRHSIADLTGIGAADAAVGSAVLDRLRH